MGLTKSFTTSDDDDDDDELNGEILEDAFKVKPIIIPAECTGKISLRAEITELNTLDDTADDDLKSETSISSNAVFVADDLDTGIRLPGGGTEVVLEFDCNTAPNSSMGNGIKLTEDSNVENLEFIPLFHSGGVVDIAYTFKNSDNEDDGLDITFDIKIMIETAPDWYQTNLSYDSQIFKNIISSENADANYPDIGENTVPKAFRWTIAQSAQMMPFEIKEYIDPKTKDDENPTGVAVKRACLSPLKFKIIAKNNEASDIYLANIHCTISWGCNKSNMFMTMSTEGNRKSKRADIYTLPEGAEKTRSDGLGFPIFAVVDGYKKAVAGGPYARPSEIFKVYASFNEHYAVGDYFYPKIVELKAVDGTDGPNFPHCLYSTIGTDEPNPLKREDFVRITTGSWMKSGNYPDGITVVDAPTIAASDKYRVITVTRKEYKSADDPECIFVITTVPNDSVDYKIDEDDLTNAVKKIHFFNKTSDFAPEVEISRSEIDKMFYETLHSTYEDAPILESIAEEPLHFVKFSINDYPKPVPIRHGQTLSFSEKLTHAQDGVRSTDIFYMDGKTPNIINIQRPIKHKYDVKFHYPHEIYEDVYII